MPRNYVRKCPDRNVCTRGQIDAAKKLIQEGKSKRAAADIIGINECTLRKRLKLNSTADSMGRFRPTFTPTQEMEIYNFCKTTDEMFYGVTLQTLRKIVFQFAEINNIDNRFDKVTKMAGKDWVYGLIKRHPTLALRQTTPTSIARAIGFNPVQVQRFYKNLKECLDQYNFSPGRIYNMDETGISTVPKKTPKVISIKGKKNVNKIVSGERGQTITAVCCASATGNYIPPAFIFPRKRMRSELLDGSPAGCIGMTSDSGFINSDLYLDWLQHFKDNVNPSVDNPVLLIVDNHSTHISLKASLFCRGHGIIVLTLPPHSSHKMQPLDRTFFSPLKGQYAVECDRWMGQHPGRAINQYQITSIFDKAFKKVATVGNATSGFHVCGIYPFNNELFTEADFAPATVTDIFSHLVEAPTVESTPSDQQSVAPIYEQPISSTSNTVIALETVAAAQIYGDTPRENLSITNEHIEVGEHSPSILAGQTESTEIPDNEMLNTIHHVPLTDISPLPKASYIQKRRKNACRSEIVTSSPYKVKMEEQQADKENKTKRVRKPNMKSMESDKKKKTGKQSDKRNKPGLSGLQKFFRQSQRHTSDYFCPLCYEKFEDPPSEDWIKCIRCESWWHEDCTDYENGSFTCDQCKEGCAYT